MSFLLLASGITEIRPGLIFWTLLTFILVAFVLRWKAWKPILDLVAEREKQIKNAIESAKRERAEAEKLLAEQKVAIAAARREAAEALQKSKADMDKFRDELMAKSRKEADELKGTAAREINAERQKALAEIKGISVDLALQIAEKLIAEKMDDSKHRVLAEQFIDQLPKQDLRRTA
ncbi:MAG: F0F1 ATP synthase subunit B [Myxococcaceae bacterium]